jgi:hypothetical protein
VGHTESTKNKTIVPKINVRKASLDIENKVDPYKESEHNYHKESDQ